MAVIPHILDSDGVIWFLHFSGSLRQAVKHWCVTHSGTVLASKCCDRSYRALRLHSYWEVQIENTSSIVCAPKDLDWPYAERLCSVLAWTEASRNCVGGQELLGKSLAKTEKRRALHWANYSWYATERQTQVSPTQIEQLKGDCGSV